MHMLPDCYVFLVTHSLALLIFVAFVSHISVVSMRVNKVLSTALRCCQLEDISSQPCRLNLLLLQPIEAPAPRLVFTSQPG